MNFTAMFNHFNIDSLVKEGNMVGVEFAVNALLDPKTIHVTLGKVGIA